MYDTLTVGKERFGDGGQSDKSSFVAALLTLLPYPTQYSSLLTSHSSLLTPHSLVGVPTLPNTLMLCSVRALSA